MISRWLEESRNGTEAYASAVAAAFAHKFRLLQLFVLLGYSVMFVLCVLLIAYMRFNRNVALKGDSAAARKIILPAFEPLLWILGATTGTYSVLLTIGVSTRFYKMQVPLLVSELFYSGRQFVVLLVIIYMLQKSVTVPALVRSVAITLLLAFYSLPLALLLDKFDNKTLSYARFSHTVTILSRISLLSIYVFIFFKPPSRASVRSIREYCVFAFVYFGCTLAYTQILYEGNADVGFVMIYVTSIWAALGPVVVWRVLIADTQHWRGMGQRAVSLQSVFRQKHNLNERVSSQGLHVLIEMHRKFIIDFAYLELKQRIGVGASAVVFRGVLHSKTDVAVKVYTPSEFSEDTVAAFSQEAALCGALHHPNIVKFFGMCVCPPTICLVSELCQGSLEDVMLAVRRRPQHAHRQQQLIDLAYMLDAARAVAYIHSFSPAFLHRDIKPGNFLIDADNTVKLTDFGESRSLPRGHVQSRGGGAGGARGASVSRSHFLSSGATLRQEAGRSSSLGSDKAGSWAGSGGGRRWRWSDRASDDSQRDGGLHGAGGDQRQGGTGAVRRGGRRVLAGDDDVGHPEPRTGQVPDGAQQPPARVRARAGGPAAGAAGLAAPESASGDGVGVAQRPAAAAVGAERGEHPGGRAGGAARGLCRGPARRAGAPDDVQQVWRDGESVVCGAARGRAHVGARSRGDDGGGRAAGQRAHGRRHAAPLEARPAVRGGGVGRAVPV
ncbi:hypothetical protein PINS_up001342 [Pythium insidiosum]|nr:hypothetical protein PINS_up001342 [Pythium insidiosum]